MTDQFGQMLRGEDLSAIAALSRADVEAYLRRLVSELADGAEPLNADRLVSLGNTLELAGWAAVDRTLTSCLAERPTERAVDVVSLILTGLWRSSIDPAALNTLAEAIRTVGRERLGPDAAYSLRTALDSARRAAEAAGDSTTAARAASLRDNDPGEWSLVDQDDRERQ